MRVDAGTPSGTRPGAKPVDAHARGRGTIVGQTAFADYGTPWFLKIREFQDLATTYALRRRAAIPPVLGH
jgi:hypothetical protein